MIFFVVRLNEPGVLILRLNEIAFQIIADAFT
jgi:hypothetical protein